MATGRRTLDVGQDAKAGPVRKTENAESAGVGPCCSVWASPLPGEFRLSVGSLLLSLCSSFLFTKHHSFFFPPNHSLIPARLGLFSLRVLPLFSLFSPTHCHGTQCHLFSSNHTVPRSYTSNSRTFVSETLCLHSALLLLSLNHTQMLCLA